MISKPSWTATASCAALPDNPPYRFDTHVAERVRKRGERIVITGAGGWLGLATLELLHHCLGADFAARVVCFGSSSRELRLMDGTAVAQRPLTEIPALPAAPTLVLHLAFLTKDRAEAMPEPEYRASNAGLSRLVLDALDQIGTQGVFVASSGAAAYADDAQADPALRLYGELKGRDEDDFAAWAQARGKRAIITRIFNISGPHMNKQDSYALGSFIRAALNGGPIEVRAPHRVVRGYVAIRQLMSLVFALLLKDAPDVARFDSGGAPMELEEVATTVADGFGGIAVHRAPITSDKANVYVGDGDAYAGLLRQESISDVSFREQVIETVRFFRLQYGLAEESEPC